MRSSVVNERNKFFDNEIKATGVKGGLKANWVKRRRLVVKGSGCGVVRCYVRGCEVGVYLEDFMYLWKTGGTRWWCKVRPVCGSSRDCGFFLVVGYLPRRTMS